MMKIEILGVFGSVVFLLLVLSLVSDDAVRHGNMSMQDLLKDPVVAELMAYVKAADAVRNDPSPAVGLTHLQEWKEQIQKVIADNPQSRFIGDVKVKLLGLSTV